MIRLEPIGRVAFVAILLGAVALDVLNCHRIGDLRRLIKYYGRTPESVFPTGAWHKCGNYGPDVNFPVPQAEENNPNVTAGHACTDRNA